MGFLLRCWRSGLCQDLANKSFDFFVLAVFEEALLETRTGDRRFNQFRVDSSQRIQRVIFGASDPKSGGITSPVALYQKPQLHHKPKVLSGLMMEECREIMKRFFAEKRGFVKEAREEG